MNILLEKLPESSGYVVTLLAVALLGYSAACAPKPQEQWNSYYYGNTMQMDQDFESGGMDADDSYRMPNDIRQPDGDRNLQVEGALHGDAYR